MSRMSSIRSLVGGRMLVAFMLLLGFLVVAFEAWFPLGSTRSYVERDQPVVDGETVEFRGRSVLESPAPPDWLRSAIDSGQLEVRMSFNASSDDQEGPARLLAITKDVRNANLMVGQDESDLVVRVRRPSSDPSGDPAFVVPDAIHGNQWQELSVRIADGRLQAVLDTRTVIDEPLGSAADSNPLSSWDSTYRLTLGDELDGDREWAGRLRDVSVVTALGKTDLLESGVLDAGTGPVEIVRERTIARPSDASPVFVALRLLIFLPVGIALGLLLRSPLLAAAVGLALPIILAFGKQFVDGRHSGATEIAVGAAGTLIGIGIARIATRGRRLTIER